MPDRLARLREAGIEEPGWHLRRLEENGGDVDGAIGRVIDGEPLHRVLGWREFHGLRLSLGSETLEPRDDTEALVSLVLRHMTPDAAFADLGAGTGAVGLAILFERPGSVCTFTDASDTALAVAAGNAEALGLLDRSRFASGSWFEPVGGRFQVIVSNPPYIASDVVDRLDPNVREHDPRLALDGGHDGLDAYRAILAGGADHLMSDGFLAVEIGYDQDASVRRLADERGWACFDEERDLSGHVRALAFRPPTLHMPENA